MKVSEWVRYVRDISGLWLLTGLICGVPLFHHARIVGYSILGIDALILIFLVAIVSFVLAGIGAGLSRGIKALFLSAIASLTIDYFLPQQPGVVLWWAIISGCVFFMLFLLKKNAHVIGSVFLVTFLASDYLVGSQVFVTKEVSGSEGSTSQEGDNVPVIHIVFDAFQSANTLPSHQEETAEQVRSFFLDHGFFLYDGAFSRHNGTHRSLNAGLNFSSEALVPNNTEDHKIQKFEHYLVNASLFADASEKGLNIIVVQSNFLDTCQGSQNLLTELTCFTYKKSYFPLHEETELSLMQRIQLLAMLAGQESLVFKNFRAITTQLWGTIPGFVRSPVSTRAAEPNVKQALADMNSQVYFYYHSLASHSPYALDSECNVRPVNKWSTDRKNKTKASRILAYERYGEQIRCNLQTLGTYLNVIDANSALSGATIIVHGDHGSRLSTRKGDYRAGSDFSKEIFNDNFPTLFAIRHRDLKAGVNDKPVGVDTLLKHHIKEMDGRPYSGPTKPFVYLLQRDGSLQRHDFGDSLISDQ